MIPVLGIPTYNRGKLLRRCLESIDHPVDRLVIVQNSNDESVQQTVDWVGYSKTGAKWNKFHHIYNGGANAGVADSWNSIIKLFPAPWWMLVNDDIQFAPGDLEKMANAANGNGETKVTDGRFESNPTPPACYYANHGASFWIVTRAGVERVGLFDENIYPAYLEDCDWSVRADRVGMPRYNASGCSSIHGEDRRLGSCTANSAPNLAMENSRTHGLNFGYYHEKWGGNNGEEKFQHPFNDPHLPVSFFRYNPGLRESQQWKL